MNTPTYFPIAFFPFHVTTNLETAICDLLTESGTLDRLYAEHLERFGNFLNPETCGEMSYEAYDAWVAFQNGITNATCDLNRHVAMLLDGVEVPEAVRSFIRATCADSNDANSHAISLLYLARKLGHIRTYDQADGVLPDSPMWEIWDQGRDFIVLMPCVTFDAGWTDAGHASVLEDAREIAKLYDGSQVYQKLDGQWLPAVVTKSESEVSEAA